MANFYVDHGAYASALGSTPTWGVPQEGDGSTKDAATAVSVGSIAFTSVPTSGAISVAGASVSTTGVIGAASADAAANALATNINATTATVSTSVANNPGNNANQLRNMVYARGPSGGAPAGTCQIMYRIGSDTLNYATNSNSQIASSLDGAPTVTQFAGGSGGCWGVLANSSALGVANSISALYYGVAVHQPTVWVAALSNESPVFARTGNSPTITISADLLRRTSSFKLRLIFDTNLVWTGDAATGTVTFRYSGSSHFTFSPAYAGTYTTGTAQWECRRSGNCVVALAGSGSNQIFTYGATSTGLVALRGVRLVIESGSGARFKQGTASYNSAALRAFGCEFDATAVTSATLPANIFNTSSYEERLSGVYIGCSFKWTLTGIPPDIVPLASAAYNGQMYLTLIDCSFSTGSAAKLRLMSSTSAAGVRVLDVVRCSGLYADFNYTGVVAASVYTDYPKRFGIGDAALSRDFRLEMPAGVVRWTPYAIPAFPTLNAMLPDGSKWSLGVDWSSVADIVTAASELMTPALVQTVRADSGVKTLTVRGLFPASITNEMLDASVYVIVAYLATDGEVKNQIVTSGFSDDATSTWDSTSGYTGHTPRKLVVTTDSAVAKYGDISVIVGFSTSCPSGTTEVVFIDPEFSLA